MSRAGTLLPRTLYNKHTAYKVKLIAVKSSVLYLQFDVDVGEVASAGTPRTVY